MRANPSGPPSMKAIRVGVTLVAFITLGAFAAFVWPTVYRPVVILPTPKSDSLR